MRRVLIGLLLGALMAGTAHAQETAAQETAAQEPHPQTRRGFWIGFGLGVGSLGCEGCDDRLSGGAAYFRLGGSASQHVLLGVELNAWAKDENGNRLTMSHINTVAYLYPWAAGGFHLKAGVGMAALDLEAAGFSSRASGGGILLGLGYDARTGRNFSLSPFLNLTSGNFDGNTAGTVQIGLGASWH